MSLHEKLRLYLAGKHASWTQDAATWADEAGAQLLIAIDGPVNADAIVDAHVRALATGSRVTLAHTGAPTSVAQRTAARFGVALLDAATLPEPAPVASPVASPVGPTPALRAPEFPIPAPGSFRALERPELELGDAAPAFAALDALTAQPYSRELTETTGEASPEVQPPVAAPVATPEPAPAPPPALVLAHSEPEPELAHVDPALPWDLSLSAPEPEPVHVEPTELLAMPWHAAHTEQHELLPAGRAARHAPIRPTMAHDWGLPWPRPVAPADGLAIADPRLWHAPERIQAVREDLDRAGAPSFGVAKPEGSAWLKRISEFGGP